MKEAEITPRKGRGLLRDEAESRTDVQEVGSVTVKLRDGAEHLENSLQTSRLRLKMPKTLRTGRVTYGSPCCHHSELLLRRPMP